MTSSITHSPKMKPYVASCYRIFYWLCWKSRLIVPLVLTSVTCALFIALLEWRQTSGVQLMTDGRTQRLGPGPEPASAAMHALRPHTKHHITFRDAIDPRSQRHQTSQKIIPYAAQNSNNDQLNATDTAQEVNNKQHKRASTERSQQKHTFSVHSLHRLVSEEKVPSEFQNLFIKQAANTTLERMLKQGEQGVINTKRNATSKTKQKPKRTKKAKPFAKLNFVAGRSGKVYYNASQTMPIAFETWLENEAMDCAGKFRGYLGEFAHLEDLIISRRFCRGKQGGEHLSLVLNQSEESEYVEIKYGCFQMRCPQKIDYFFNGENHMNSWLLNLQHDKIQEDKVTKVISDFTIAVTRYEYVNMYHTMTDWYNAFLMMNFFNRTQRETNILIVDAHPEGTLDPVWVALFNSTRRLSALDARTHFKDMVWSLIGYSSPFTDHLEMTVPLIEEFRQFFLTSYRIVDTKQLDCDRLSILFLWRHNYVAHPRNPTGAISRKIKNERALLGVARDMYPQFNIEGLQLDLFDMHKQLQIIAQTDILIGMHGAGLTHAVFLPKHAGLIEFIPSYWSAANEHFMAIAGWRKLIYERWTNTDPHNEYPDHYTYIPLDVEQLLLQRVIHQMCDVDQNVTSSS